jgi:RND family efflux transporter MFP subunit
MNSGERKYFIIAALKTLFLTCFSAGLIGCSKNSSEVNATAAKLPPKKVVVAKAELLPSESVVLATGTLAAMDRAVLSAKVPGRVREIKVDLGSRVKKGDLLAQIDQRDFELKRQQAEAALAQARAQLGIALDGKDDQIKPANISIVKEAQAVLTEATKNRERIASLREQGIIAQAELESVEATYQVAANRYEEALHEVNNRLAILEERQADLAFADQELKDAAIRAPFDGVIETRQTSPGEYLKEGMPVLTLVRIDPLRLRAEVPERDAHKLKLNQPVRLHLEGASEVYFSQISRLSPVISANNRMLVAEADFKNEDGSLRPGSFAKVEIVVNKAENKLFIPQSALITFAGIQKVFLLSKGQAIEKEVRAILGGTNKTQIISGLNPGDVVIIDPGNLRSGQAVEISLRET